MMPDLRELKNKHAGQDIWVLGSGPSMNYVDPAFFDNKITVSVNFGFRRFRCDYLVAKTPWGLDERYQPGEELDLTQEPYTLNSALVVSRNSLGAIAGFPNVLPPGAYVFDHSPNLGPVDPDVTWIGKDVDALVVSFSTITSALHLAAYMGAANIMLCGCDGGILDGKDRFDGYRDTSYTADRAYYRTFCRQNRIVSDRLQDVYGCRVYGLNPWLDLTLEGHEVEVCEPVANQNPSRLSTYGYSVVRGVFSKSEVDQFHSAFDKGVCAGDLLSHPALHSVVYDKRIMQALRDAGMESPCYWLESCMIAGGGVGFHRDNADRVDPLAPDWSEGYCLIRVGIYLEDCAGQGGGIEFKAGSHRSPESDGEVHYADTRPGDIVLWDLRTLHAANGGGWRPKSQNERRCVFITYGAEDRHTERYINYLSTRRYQIDAWAESRVPDDVKRQAEEAGLRVIGPTESHLTGPLAGTSDDWSPIPY